MKVQQSFVIDQPRDRVWSFFLNIPDVARCVPGVEEVEVIDPDHSRVRLTQSVGPMSATFDLKMRITERAEAERLQFTASGKAVKGAAGSVRTVNTVSLAPEGEGTRVQLDADMAMGGVLGSIGQKVIARQATGITADFAAALERALLGEAPAAGEASVAPEALAAGEAPTAGATAAPPAASTAGDARGPDALASGTRVAWHEDPRITGLAGLSVGLAIAVIVALRRR